MQASTAAEAEAQKQDSLTPTQPASGLELRCGKEQRLEANCSFSNISTQLLSSQEMPLRP